MKSLTIVTTWGPKYWPKPVQAGIQSTVKNWPGHAKILLYPDDMSQQLELPRTKYYDLCKSLDHKPGNVVMLSHAHDNSMIYGTAKDLLNYEKG